MANINIVIALGLMALGIYVLQTDSPPLFKGGKVNSGKMMTLVGGVLLGSGFSLLLKYREGLTFISSAIHPRAYDYKKIGEMCDENGNGQ